MEEFKDSALSTQRDKWGGGGAGCWGSRPRSTLGLIGGALWGQGVGNATWKVPGPEEGRPSLTRGGGSSPARVGGQGPTLPLTELLDGAGWSQAAGGEDRSGEMEGGEGG